MEKKETKTAKRKVAERVMKVKNDIPVTKEQPNSVQSSASESITPTVAVKRNVEFSPDYLVECRSVRTGTLLLEGRKTKQLYRWENDNDTTLLEYQDVFAEVNRKSDYIFTPYFLIEDEDVLNSTRFKVVKDFYNTFYETDINKIMTLDNEEFSKVLREVPKGLLDAIRVKAATLIESGTLDSIQKVKEIDSICGSDLISVLDAR